MAELVGWLAAALTLVTFSMRSMAALRMAAIGANLCFIAYGFMSGLAPVLSLHLLLLPCNLLRLAQLCRTEMDDPARRAPSPVAKRLSLFGSVGRRTNGRSVARAVGFALTAAILLVPFSPVGDRDRPIGKTPETRTGACVLLHAVRCGEDLPGCRDLEIRVLISRPWTVVGTSCAGSRRIPCSSARECPEFRGWAAGPFPLDRHQPLSGLKRSSSMTAN